MDVHGEHDSAEVIAPSAYAPQELGIGPAEFGPPGGEALQVERPVQGQRRIFRQILPTLNRILGGGASVTFDLLGKRAEMEDPAPFFTKKSLNDVVIFKFPNFGLSPRRNRPETPWTKHFRAVAGLPVETGLFRPYSAEDPTMGGLAIYLRQPDFVSLLTHHLGFDLTSDEDEVKADRKRLEILDGIPSLDPFLMKYAFDEAHLPCDPRYLNLTPEEEQQIRITIERQIRPIVEKAMPGSAGMEDSHTGRMVDLLWEPGGAQASQFLKAFRFAEYQRDDVLSGFRGICYYRAQVDENAKETRALLTWLRSSKLDASSRYAGDASHELIGMLKGTILTKVNGLLQQIADVFADYDAAVMEFVEHNDPTLLRKFLLVTKDKYWFLGRSTSSLRHVCDLKRQVESTDDLRTLSLDQLARTLLYMQYSLR